MTWWQRWDGMLLSYHQATSGQHAIWALAMAPLRRLALSVLFTIVTTSYQTTLYSLREIFNKRQHANARYKSRVLALRQVVFMITEDYRYLQVLSFCL